MPKNSFPGYKYISAEEAADHVKHNMYRGIDLGFGGYVYAKPGMYGKTVCFDISGMHPASIRAMNCFGKYTQNFGDLVDARVYIKHKDFDSVRKMFDGKLEPYLNDESMAKALSKALKIAVNSCYGLTSASFENPMRDSRNVNNIVALRGALFMKTLQDDIESKGYKVAHIKTDSIKVVDPDKYIADYIIDKGHEYDYNFEIEHSFDRICLVNDAVYIAKCAEDDPETPGKWTATGAQFAVPYVFKTLFSKEPIEFSDLCETKTVTSSLYLDMNEGLNTDEHNYIFVGRAGLFCPMKPGTGGGELVRDNGKGGYASATGCKGWRWMETEMVEKLGKKDDIDIAYYRKLVDDAKDTIGKYGNFDNFVSEGPYIPDFLNVPETAEEGVPFDEI